MMSPYIVSRSGLATFIAAVVICYYIFSWSSETHRLVTSPIEDSTEPTPSPVSSLPNVRPVHNAPSRAKTLATTAQAAPTARYTPDALLTETEASQIPVPYRDGVVEYDLQETEEEKSCRQSNVLTKAPIPKVVHFVMLSDPGKQSDLTFRHFLAIKAASLRIQPDKIKIHTHNFNYNNTYWKQISKRVKLVVHDRTALPGPNNHRMQDIPLAHQSDILRLDVLRKEGGIYLDTDVYALKPFDSLLHNQKDIILGHEGGDRNALCNAIIVARPQNEFIRRWQEQYATYDPNLWNLHSVIVPKMLQRKHPDLICALAPHIFFWPTYRPVHVEYMHKVLDSTEKGELLSNMTLYGGAMYPDQLANHGWGVMAPDLQDLTLEDVLTKDTRFNILLRDIAKAEL